MPSFYFWNSGAPLQRSQCGLLRGLLFDILSYRRDLIQFVFASEWDSIRAVIGKAGMLPERDFPMKRLEEAFIALSDLSSAEFKICFFIDGLDEYGGDPELLLNLFVTIA